MHGNSRLVSLFKIFIKKYVQCYGCGNPETKILISKTQMISLKCDASGFVSDVDMKDKLTTFILKNMLLEIHTEAQTMVFNPVTMPSGLMAYHF